MIDIEKHRTFALKILSPIKPIDENTIADGKKLLFSRRSTSSYELPAYYLIYFLFQDLLGYNNGGQFEKVAWSFIVDYKGKAYLIEHRKFGVGIFVQDEDTDQSNAREIALKIRSAVKSIRPFYDHIAAEAVKNSKFNITNRNTELYERFEYLLSLYKKEASKYQNNKDKRRITQEKTEIAESTYTENLGYKYAQRANWLAISCIEAFFSWTEHLFIHIAVITRKITTGVQVSELVEAEWKTKFRTAIGLENKHAVKFYDELLIVRQQLRNFVAHGAFGKDGNAFSFHSGAGAVPVILTHRQKNRFSLHGTLSFKDDQVIGTIEQFIQFLWNSDLTAAMHYTQEADLPTILPYASNGRYAAATASLETMKEFSYHLMMEFDNAANMDW